MSGFFLSGLRSGLSVLYFFIASWYGILGKGNFKTFFLKTFSVISLNKFSVRQRISSWLTNITFYHVNNITEKQRNDSVKWILNQTDAGYQLFFPIFTYKQSWYKGMWDLGTKCADPNDNSVKTSNRFYCCELIWAGFYNNGIDLDPNGWEEIKPEIAD